MLPVIIAMVWIDAAAGDWWAGSSLGNRRLCSLTIVLMLGLASLVLAGGRWLRRLPVPGRHVIALAVLGWFVAFNMTQVFALRHGKAANSRRRLCCHYMEKPFSTVAQPIYDLIGNPFALPASALFAWRHGVPIQRWDVAVGEWADMPNLANPKSGTNRRARKVWNLPGAGFTPWLAGGFGPRQVEGKSAFRWTVDQVARALVPLWLPDERIFEVAVVPNVGPGDPPMRLRVLFNGETYFDSELGPGGHRVRVEVPASNIRVGTNELAFCAEPRPHRVGVLTPPPAGRAGVAVHQIALTYPQARK